MPTPCRPAIGDLRLQLDYSWRDNADLQPNDQPGVSGPGTPGTPDSVRIQRSYGLLNAEARLHIEPWNADIDFFGKNLTNQRYFGSELGVVSAWRRHRRRHSRRPDLHLALISQSIFKRPPQKTI